MKIKVSFQRWSMLATGLAALAMTACGSSGGGGSGGGGGAGGDSNPVTSGSVKPTSSGSGASTSTMSSGSTSGAGSSTSSTSSSGTGTPAAANVIDDMEDKNNAILASEGRQGYWYTYNDGTGKQTPEPLMVFDMTALAKPRSGSTYAANTKGSGFIKYGAGMGFDLNVAGASKSVYDASMYTGITFYAMVGAGSVKPVRVNLVDKNTALEGGVCTRATCYDHFGTTISLTEDWQQFTIKFSELKQQGFGDPQPAVTPSALYSVQFQADKDVNFDIWVDDIAFSK